MKTLLITAATALAVAAAPAAGLAKEKGHGPHKAHPHGMPPGQAKKVWSAGERLPATYISPRYYVTEPWRYDLAPAPYGYRYVRVGDRIYLAQDETGLIRDVLTGLLR